MKYPEYDSPIDIVLNDMATQIAKQTDDMTFKAIQKVGITVDKEKLIRILAQDSQRYREAFCKGEETGYAKREEAIVRCKDCKYWWYGNYCDKHGKGQENADWFCADGEREEQT